MVAEALTAAGMSLGLTGAWAVEAWAAEAWAVEASPSPSTMGLAEAVEALVEVVEALVEALVAPEDEAEEAEETEDAEEASLATAVLVGALLALTRTANHADRPSLAFAIGPRSSSRL